MHEYEVTFTNGEVVVIDAWSPESAWAIAEDSAEQIGLPGLDVVRVELLDPQPIEW